jgi:hypothetical protein
MKPTRLAVLAFASFWICACGQAQTSATTGKAATQEEFVVAADKPFVAGGSVSIHLDGGSYEIAPAPDNQIRVTLSGTIGKAKVELNIDRANADLAVKDTQSHFQALIEVPSVSDLTVRLTGGNLVIGPITGNKDIGTLAGNVEIGIGNPEDYASVNASVKAGDITAEVFGGSRSGLLQHFDWAGSGRYRLHAQLGAGNLDLRGK